MDFIKKYVVTNSLADQSENRTLEILQAIRKYSVYFKVKVSVILKMALKLKTSDATCSLSISPESHLTKTPVAKMSNSEEVKILKRRRRRVVYPLVL